MKPVKGRLDSFGPLVCGEHLRPYVDWNEVERMLIDMGVIKE
jgi:hypothetical protein